MHLWNKSKIFMYVDFTKLQIWFFLWPSGFFLIVFSYSNQILRNRKTISVKSQIIKICLKYPNKDVKQMDVLYCKILNLF